MIKKRAISKALFIKESKEGMVTLKQDAIQKMLLGFTDIRNVSRISIG